MKPLAFTRSLAEPPPPPPLPLPPAPLGPELPQDASAAPAIGAPRARLRKLRREVLGSTLISVLEGRDQRGDRRKRRSPTGPAREAASPCPVSASRRDDVVLSTGDRRELT